MTQPLASQLPPDVRAEYPFASNVMEVAPASPGEGPVRLHYLDEGTGPVVVLLHGNPTWSFFYRNAVLALKAAGFRCVVPDHVGCGLSDKPQGYPYTLARRIGDVERLLEHLGIGRFSLVVHDWGGAIGCGVAVRRPEALERLVLLNTAAFPSRRIPLRILCLKTPGIGPLVIRGLNGFARPALNMASGVPLSGVARRGLLWPYRSWADRVAVWDFVRDIPLRPGHPSYAALAEVRDGLPLLADKPVRILWGGKDFCFNRHFYETWRRLFPGAEATWYPAYGHYALEDGRGELERAIVAFLRERRRQV